MSPSVPLFFATLPRPISSPSTLPRHPLFFSFFATLPQPSSPPSTLTRPRFFSFFATLLLPHLPRFFFFLPLFLNLVTKYIPTPPRFFPFFATLPQPSSPPSTLPRPPSILFFCHSSLIWWAIYDRGQGLDQLVVSRVCPSGRHNLWEGSGVG